MVKNIFKTLPTSWGNFFFLKFKKISLSRDTHKNYFFEKICKKGQKFKNRKTTLGKNIGIICKKK